METAKYRLVAYLRIESEDTEPLTYTEALAEKEQQEFLFPEHVFRIEEIELANRKEAPCIPPASRKI